MTTDAELLELESKINQKNEEIKASAPPPAKEEPVVEPETPKSEPVPVEEKSDPADVAEPSGETPAESFDPKAYVEKKGWKTAEDAAKSLREMEKRFHEKNQELKRLKDTQAPAPGYMPPPNPYGYPPPPPPPPQPMPYGYGPVTPSMSEEQIAMSYGWTVEDLRRAVPLMRDIVAVEQVKIRNEIEQWKSNYVREQEKQSDYNAVLSDPAFQSLDVQKEMESLLTNNPEIFNERRPYSTALKDALANIGRKNMTRGSSGQPGTSLPSVPPVTAGASHANGTTPRSKSGGMPTQEQWEKMPIDEQEKWLKRMNAFKTYQDFA